MPIRIGAPFAVLAYSTSLLARTSVISDVEPRASEHNRRRREDAMDAPMPSRTGPRLWIAEVPSDLKMRAADVTRVFVFDHSPLPCHRPSSQGLW
jgi:hypothetical protein